MTVLDDAPAVYGHCGHCGRRFTSTADQDHHLAATGHGRIEFIVDTREAERTPAQPGSTGTGRPASPYLGSVDDDGTRAGTLPAGAGPDLLRIRESLAMHPAGTGPVRRALTPEDRLIALQGLQEARRQLARARRRAA